MRLRSGDRPGPKNVHLRKMHFKDTHSNNLISKYNAVKSPDDFSSFLNFPLPKFYSDIKQGKLVVSI